MRRSDGLRITSPLRTLSDIALTLDEAAFAHAANEAQVLRLVTRAELAAGGPRLRVAALEPGFTQEEGERRLRALLRRAGLCPTGFNVGVLGHRVDVLFAPQKLILELDGWAAHGTRKAFEQDRERMTVHAAAGYRTIRITWRHLTEGPELLIARIATALANASVR